MKLLSLFSIFLLFILTILFFFSHEVYAASSLNDRPIIGVLAEPASGSHKGQAYIAASYIKYVEGAGARAVPIVYSWDETKLRYMFRSVNGILFPGGGVNLDRTPYEKTEALLYKWAIDANDNGDYFPIWGTCLGFESLAVITSNDPKILSHFDSYNISLPLRWTVNPHTTRMFRNAPDRIIHSLTNHNITLNNHHAGVSIDTFKKSTALNSFYDLISINTGRQGNTFVSTWEAKKYPIYGVQWHPEKPIYEWLSTEAINHSAEAVEAMQYMANFFVSEARKNHHSFPSSSEETKALIYNYSPVYTGIHGSDFEQCYYFDE